LDARRLQCCRQGGATCVIYPTATTGPCAASNTHLHHFQIAHRCLGITRSGRRVVHATQLGAILFEAVSLVWRVLAFDPEPTPSMSWPFPNESDLHSMHHTSRDTRCNVALVCDGPWGPMTRGRDDAAEQALLSFAWKGSVELRSRAARLHQD
jgi:hypothetical protein